VTFKVALEDLVNYRTDPTIPIDNNSKDDELRFGMAG
jgi:hypothetical protein